MNLRNQIFQGHCLNVLKTFPEKSINMCVTSPPYYGPRDYETEPQDWGDWKGELGREPNPDLYINHLCQIFNEVWRVLMDNGTLWVNIDDSHGKNKSLLGIPARFQLAMIQKGWICRNVIIWYKGNSMPESCTDRFTIDFEYFYFFSKQEDYYFEQLFESAYATPWSNKSKKGGIQAVNNPRQHFKTYKDKQASELGCSPSSGLRQKQKPQYKLRRNIRSVWLVNTVPHPEAHFAIFPEKLIEIPIKTCSKMGDLILDPFLGSGTTMNVAKSLARDCVGIDLNPEYIQIADKKTEALRKCQKMDMFMVKK